MPTTRHKIWSDGKGKFYHDACFEEGESRDGYNAVAIADLADDDACESCGGIFLQGLLPADEVDDDDDDDVDDDEE